MADDKILKRLEEIALDCGFTFAGKIDAATVKPRQDIRDECAKCRNYGKSWTCPPACGSLEECEERVRQYTSGLLLQTTGSLEKDLDWEGMKEAGRKHRENILAFEEKMESFFTPEQQWMLLGAGGCKICEKCSYPEPCINPEKRKIVSMEATGIFIIELSKANNITYHYGPKTLTYVACLLV